MRIRPDTLENNGFDVIVISRFLDRTLCNAIMAALKPEGLLFYQTFIRAAKADLLPGICPHRRPAIWQQKRSLLHRTKN
jgi:2-polyprenyl-3-methyl-5-hydroxy-6-metoxy-1,4-benzoquinol methylase